MTSQLHISNPIIFIKTVNFCLQCDMTHCNQLKKLWYISSLWILLKKLRFSWHVELGCHFYSFLRKNHLYKKLFNHNSLISLMFPSSKNKCHLHWFDISLPDWPWQYNIHHLEHHVLNSVWGSLRPTQKERKKVLQVIKNNYLNLIN